VLELLLPGDPATRTGGFVYARRIAAGLSQAGWTVRVRRLSVAFPHPQRADLDHAARVLQGLADGALVLIDGLACGAMPEVVMRHAGRLRLVALVHHPLALESGLDAGAAARLALSERRALSAVRHVITTSAHTAGVLARDYGVPAPMLSTVEPGTDPAAAAAGSGGPRVQLLCVATLTPRKGHALLLEALARVPGDGWGLGCAGSERRDPDTAAAVRARIRELRLDDRVRLHGEVDDAALAALYHAADVFVLPTALEGFGMALAEALAHALPVVSTRAGAVPDTGSWP